LSWVTCQALGTSASTTCRAPIHRQIEIAIFQ
jgi:hypothetical protein